MPNVVKPQEPQRFSEDPWLNFMLQGKFEDAWKISDRVLQERAGKPCWHLPRHQQYFWDGTSLQGKNVLVRCYHGLGDTIQFSRYIPALQTMAKNVIVWIQPPLIPLLQTLAGGAQLLPLHDGTPEAAFDVDIEIMELPHIFRTTPDTVPKKVPYLHIEPQKLVGENKLAVGLVWKAGDWDHRRNIPYPLLQPLFEVADVTVLILQGAAKAAGWIEGDGVYLGELELYDYAKVVKGLDLLITIDSMPAHLAGAMGVPVWTLLHADADWRWMRNREDSPWYPTMRLFRQEKQDLWAPVIDKVKVALRKRISASKNP